MIGVFATSCKTFGKQDSGGVHSSENPSLSVFALRWDDQRFCTERTDTSENEHKS